MDTPLRELHLADSVLHQNTESVVGEYKKIQDEMFYCICNFDLMPPFFMNLVSSSDHWFFISSTGGLSAGRQNAESSLFPYYTVDKITENADNTGHVAVFLVPKENRTFRWEPFSNTYRGLYQIRRNLYKNVYGNKIIFEEINADLELTYRYSWQTSDEFGFVKTSWVENNTDETLVLNMIDGLQNLLPYGATTALQTAFSNLLNGYKRNELNSQTGLGIYTLSSSLTDLAEPSESLKATTVWQVGLPNAQYLLSTLQLEKFKQGGEVTQETDVRGRRGAFLVNTQLPLSANDVCKWSIVAEVNQDHSRVVSLNNALKNNRVDLPAKLYDSMKAGTTDLLTLVASADGLQVSADNLSATHHFSNVLFNIMRGGIFLDNHYVYREDFTSFIQDRNSHVYAKYLELLETLPHKINFNDLHEFVTAVNSADLERLCYEFLPLTFSRRHGDPSRPWNQFSINIKNPDGSRRLDYQGNWRDIFQNWEPLAYAYPEFIESMICKFVNATTADGYNPYRITSDGVEWEVPAPDDPWANIGYWSDHQIIYLQKLLEISSKFHPGKLERLLTHRVFSHTNVPYRLKEYEVMLENWYDTIEFDQQLNEKIGSLIENMGSDGKLILDDHKNVFHVNLVEKLLTLLLAKLSNFVPGGGIWMNTQRPEWNDANNALVGKGLSVVTLCYLRRYIVFFRNLVVNYPSECLNITKEISRFFNDILHIFDDCLLMFDSPISDELRRNLMDKLGLAGSHYRTQLYHHGLSGDFVPLKVNRLVSFLNTALLYVEHTIALNKRSDNLYHAYNVLELGVGCASIRYLYEMLEGQVAILSSGLLSGEQSLELLQSLRKSRMYREDQHSYMLYPDRDLPGFLGKNTLSEEQIGGSKLIAKLLEDGNKSLMLRDENGEYHFNGAFKNARDVENILNELKRDTRYKKLVEEETQLILELFENVFDHNAFTGRSGTFFAYEGLGSIYWHMVSKLLLAVQEVFYQAVENGESQRVLQELAKTYYDIRSGIGFNKSPDVYGAFPTDPYSHTPAGQGAKQPGMTGQVKEECVTRFGELGVLIHDGVLSFKTVLLRKREFLDEAATFDYIDVTGLVKTIKLPEGSLAFTFCQVPITYHLSSEKKIEVKYVNGHIQRLTGNSLDGESSDHIIRRDGVIEHITVYTEPVLDI